MKKFLKAHEILPDSIWTSCDGTGILVTILRVEEGWVYYKDVTGQEFDKDVFSFQVRYYHPELS